MRSTVFSLTGWPSWSFCSSMVLLRTFSFISMVWSVLSMAFCRSDSSPPSASRPCWRA